MKKINDWINLVRGLSHIKMEALVKFSLLKVKIGDGESLKKAKRLCKENKKRKFL